MELDFPTYSVLEAANHLRVPKSTISYWAAPPNPYSPLTVVEPASDTLPTLLSFLNLAELHVLSTLRRKHKLKMQSIREAILYLSEEAESEIEKRHPLLSPGLQTDGTSLFLEIYGRLTNVSFGGQLAMQRMLYVALSRISRDDYGLPIKIYPLARHYSIDDAPTIVSIDPQRSWGRPVIDGTGLATQIIGERFNLGESIEDLVKDYDRPRREIEEAIRWEMPVAA